MGTGTSVAHVDDDSSQIPNEVIGMTSFNGKVLIYTKQNYVEVRSKSEVISSRFLSLTPSCACAIESETYIIGFQNGCISEFDSDLNLLMTYSLPGSTKAHSENVLCVASSKNCHLFSIGSDKVAHIWDSTGTHIKSFTSKSTYNVACCSSKYCWVSDTNSKISVIDLSTNTMTYPLDIRSNATSMAPLPNETCCIAALDDGSVCILTALQVIAQFTFSGRPKPIRSICPLKVDNTTGLISYVAVDSDGVLTLRALECIVSEIGACKPFFAATKDEIIVLMNDHISRYSRAQLEEESVKDLGRLELPRKQIVQFL
ncbi:hypothetical protein GPJ56_002913 [Histomonas meleagridis]|uniref:uncharacterized protein n=1 Tax=Histomonas meleagridis TaxID=135588 RepID=UPI003559E1F0|nr:hypothetical protein GPJ56_002913 [Histomonas meleagridis]KAH0800386.1 hypothetical protein GO595_006797 [Histomonas meleagridis]